MEDMNMSINQSGGFYGLEYGDLRVGGSMMALMTEQEQDQQNGENMMSVSVPLPLPLHPSSAFSSYNNTGHGHGHGHVEALLSAAAIFNGGVDHHHSKHLVGGHFQTEQLVMNEQPPVFSDSSLSSVKMEIHSNHLELHRKGAAIAAAAGGGGGRRPFWPEPSLVVRALSQYHHHYQQEKESIVTSMEEESESPTHNNSKESIDATKAKIAAHPHYPRLLAAYMECHKSGASPEVVALLDEMIEGNLHGRMSPTISLGADPELDQFMEAYCKMLGKQQAELSKTFKEAMVFINKMETQLNSLGMSLPPGYVEREEAGGSSDEELSCGEMELNEVDPRAEDKELKDQLLRKYSGYFSTLKKEFLKKRKKGKLPKEARQKLLEWWDLHNKWPYPSETDKVVLAENTGLDQKQINNWFINQRKRHWKAPEDMEQLIVMDGLNPQAASFYIDGLDG